MQKLVELTGLSAYCLDLLYDFNPQRFATSATETAKEEDEDEEAIVIEQPHQAANSKAPKQQMLDIICHNRHVFAFNKEALKQEAEATQASGAKRRGESALRKAIVQRREQALEVARKAGDVTPQEKDYTLVHEFLGTAYTSCGHFIYCYYTGPAERNAQDLGTVQNWRPVDKQHLALFHKRLGKNVARYYAFQSADVTETADGRENLDIDMRFVVNKWLNSQQGEKLLPLLRENGHLFVRGEDYLARRHQQQQQTSQRPVAEKRSATQAALTDGEGPEFVEGEDPYEVRDAELCHISDADYDRVCEVPLDGALQFGFQHFIDVSRRSCARKEGHEAPPQYYEHDPMQVITAALIALNLELHAQSSVALAMRQHLRVVVNDDMTAIIDYLTQDPIAVQDMLGRAEEYLWANEAVENATRSVPQHLLEKLETARVV